MWIQRIPTLLIIVYVCISSGYAQINNDCGLQRFRCSDGQCIPSELLCDGKANCRDSSDETVTACKKLELCPPYAFRCNYGACVNGNSMCDGKKDCVDNSDESWCPKNTTDIQTVRPLQRCNLSDFTCNNGDCIKIEEVCNGHRNCADGSDEVSIICSSIRCFPSAFRCDYGACIDDDLQCNGIIDCADGSDEDSRCTIRWSSPLPTIRSTTQPLTPTPREPSVIPGTNTCRAPPQPQNGHWKLDRSQCSSGQECNVPEGTELGLGSRLIYSCNSGYKIRGPAYVSCSIGRKWLNIPVCIEIRCQALTTASIVARCTYNDKWISCESPVPPRTKAKLECQNSYQPETNLLSGQRKNVRCNANGQWEPEPMRCIPVCGTLPPDVTPTIIDGVKPNITGFPWHAGMYRDELDEPKKYFCGASIIQENLLITAAHCVFDENTRQLVNPSEIYILTGNLFRKYNYPHHNPTLVKSNQVKHIYIVRNYLGFIGNYLWDIAILELVRPFVLSTWLIPVCIDTFSDRNILEVGSFGKVAGFGRTASGDSNAILQALTVPVIPFTQCKSASQSANTEQFITNDKFCAGYINGSSICDNDSGGGLVLENELWYLRGIVSVSLGTIRENKSTHCDNNMYSLYTDISKHILWIQDVITKIEQDQRDALCSTESQTRCS